jgi:hypothetical protein
VTGTLTFDVTGPQVTGSLNASVGGNSLPSQSFTGTQTCGQVQASQTETVLGVSITASLTGTVAAGGTATGTWSASANGSVAASGTFTATQ